ncbi:recombinase family protein [Nocardia sp. XZ_19_369]|uniref:recombinase family protein n=1 Tax=Nocardia sp. XZ_19_369 TaxID=2769487 RepID=UPI00188E83BB|nr:recombinase family protein [Nocardia sp. XZ_19_369]
MTSTGQATAIGYLRSDKSADPDRDEQIIRELAAGAGYRLAEIYTPGEEIEPGPTLWLLEKIHSHKAAAVIIADNDQLPVDKRLAITNVCSIVSPLETVAGHVQYPGG